ncbi:hypothetical protein CSPAE12_09591 [Colletotrichum incanum]|nr:hypothetical protein CSPAE12_09591 [Colletotrichum incanum]
MCLRIQAVHVPAATWRQQEILHISFRSLKSRKVVI